jgi:hypothetical protein
VGGINMEKNWRYHNVEEYYNDILPYIDKKVNKVKAEINNYSKKKKDKLLKDISKYDRLKKENALEVEILEAAANIVKQDVDDWIRASTDPNTPIKEIILRSIYGKTYNFNFICQNLLYNNINITDEVIEDLTYIRSSMFDFSSWNDKNVLSIMKRAAVIEEATFNDSKYAYRTSGNYDVRIVFDLESYFGSVSEVLKFLNKYITEDLTY